MAFRTRDFMRAKFEQRTEKVRCLDLADFFDGDPDWTIRGLTAQELAGCEERAMKGRKSLTDIIAALSDSVGKETTDAIKSLIGVSDETPEDTAKRFEWLVAGSVEPKMDMPAAIKLATAFPAAFLILTGKIYQLSLKGMTRAAEKKPSNSGATPTSEQP